MQPDKQPDNPTPRNDDPDNNENTIREENIAPDGDNETTRLRDLLPPEDELDDAPPMETLDEAELPADRADLADDAQEEQLRELDAQQLADRNTGDDEAMYGGDDTDYDQEYYDNEDEYQYYDDQNPQIHPDQ